MNNLVIDMTHGGVKIAISLAKKGRNVLAYDIYNTLNVIDRKMLDIYDIWLIDDLGELETYRGEMRVIHPVHLPLSHNEIIEKNPDLKYSFSTHHEIIEELRVSTSSVNTPVRRLSGGNVQKVLVGREIAFAPKVLMAAYPVRGLDINSSYMIYNLLNKQKENGVAVIFVGEDLDVLLALCDRIMVVNSGAVTGVVDARTATKEEIGLLMTKTDRKEDAK